MSLRPTCFAILALCACAEPNYGAKQNDAVVADASDASPMSLRNTDGGTRDTGSTVVDAEAHDAELEIAPEEDAGPRTPVVPAWAEPLRGPFASRAVLFRQDELLMTRGVMVRLHQFVLAEGGLQLRSKPCQYTASTSLATSTWLDPSAAPEQTERVLFSDVEQRWSTDGEPIQYGFTRALPAICAGKVGELVNKPAEQVWTSSPQCRCAEIAEEPLSDDCRVLDPDGDMQPGFTFHFAGTGILGEADVFGGIDSASHFVNGQLRADGTLRANVRAADTNYQFGCLPAGCQNVAVLGKWCPSTINSVEFVPLKQTEPSCQDVLAALDTLFPAALPTRDTCFQ